MATVPTPGARVSGPVGLSVPGRMARIVPADSAAAGVLSAWGAVFRQIPLPPEPCGRGVPCSGRFRCRRSNAGWSTDCGETCWSATLASQRFSCERRHRLAELRCGRNVPGSGPRARGNVFCIGVYAAERLSQRRAASTTLVRGPALRARASRSMDATGFQNACPHVWQIQAPHGRLAAQRGQYSDVRMRKRPMGSRFDQSTVCAHGTERVSRDRREPPDRCALRTAAPRRRRH
jgi:hypothetical protein